MRNRKPKSPDRIERLITAGGVSRPIPLRRPIERYAATGAKTATHALADDRGH